MSPRARRVNSDYDPRANFMNPVPHPGILFRIFSRLQRHETRRTNFALKLSIRHRNLSQIDPNFLEISFLNPQIKSFFRSIRFILNRLTSFSIPFFRIFTNPNFPILIFRSPLSNL